MGGSGLGEKLRIDTRSNDFSSGREWHYLFASEQIRNAIGLVHGVLASDGSKERCYNYVHEADDPPPG